MIPFNHLGWFFKRFGGAAYPAAAIESLSETLQRVRANGVLLDLGAGTGTLGNYAYACRSDLRFFAADPAEGMLRYLPDHVEKVVAKAEALPFEPHTFDAIVIGEALHHFDNVNLALTEIRRVLRPGGLLFIYEFDPSAPLGNFICRAEKLLGEPANFYPPLTLGSMLEGIGFSVKVLSYRWRYTLHAQVSH